jgi:hypothetical protein
MIIGAEYNDVFPNNQEFTDWINCVDYEYNEEDNVPPVLTVTDKVSFKYNTEEYSPYATVNS